MTNVNPFTHLELQNIPRLPIPPLKDTLDYYLRLLKPLLTNEEFARTKQNVEQFLQTEGPILDVELHELAKKTPTSWLEGIWDTGYLAYRVPCPIHVNPGFSFEAGPIMTQAGRAAQFLESISKFLQNVKLNKLPIDKERDIPLCMSQYWRLLGTTRRPYPGRCKVATYPGSRHIAVIYRRQFYKIDVLLPPADGSSTLGKERIVPASVLEQQIQWILHNTEREDTHQARPEREWDDGVAEGGLGVLTAAHRDFWATARVELLAEGPSGLNAASLETVDSALLVLCLDDQRPETPLAINETLLHNQDGTGRWFDKLALIVFANGLTGWNMEHAPYDGHTLTQFSTAIYDDTTGRKRIPLDGVALATEGEAKKSIRGDFGSDRLGWAFSRQTRRRIREAREEFRQLVQTTELAPMDFRGIGKEWIKQQRVSPDAFVQMAFQLANYRHNQAKDRIRLGSDKVKGHLDSTYESSLTKRFYHGRTECVRSASSDALAFCEAWTDVPVTSPGAPSLEEKVRLLQKAIKTHVEAMDLCKNGKGVDRHLLGLQTLAKHKQILFPNYEIPAIFEDPAYGKFCGSVVSTSNCGSHAFEWFSFGPVLPNGLGLGYMIHDEKINIVVSSFIREATIFRNLLERALLEMKDTMDRFLILSNTQKKLPAKL